MNKPLADAIDEAVAYLEAHADNIRECHCTPPDYTDWNTENAAKKWHRQVKRLAKNLRDASPINALHETED